MSTPNSAPSVRIGNDERESATNALDEHLRAGRLDADEYADRMVQVNTARFFAELEALFNDLPAPHPTPPPRPAAAVAVALSKGPPNNPAGREDERRQAVGGRAGETLVALSPFIALALFFLVPWDSSWLFFVLIPVISVLVYGGGRGRRHGR
ncbi:MAG: hypothetical protein DLM58_05975 [Pseudonocardiales bacterium]|nr:MAG: hypothetical protein DLM58_05975 [Pseudonocardiales bacterium]